MEVKEIDVKNVNNVMFKRIGVDVPILSEDGAFEWDHVPARALAISNRFGYICFAHSRGFSVAKTVDLLDVAEKLSADADGIKTAQEAGTTIVTLPEMRSLSLSSDDLTVCACAGGDVMFYELATLVHKSDTRPFEVRKVDPDDEAKDFCWSPSKSEAYLILTSQGKLLLGEIGSAPEPKAGNAVVAASWSADGKHIAYVTDSLQLNITTSNFAKSFQHELPDHLLDEDNDSDLQVDAIRWVRPDSIVIGYLRVNSEGEEDECPLFVLNSKNGDLAQEDGSVLGLVFYQVFPSVDPFAVPSGSGPYMLVDYVKPWELVVSASRKSIDDHIVLMGWFPEDDGDVLYSVEVGKDVWIPRIELQDDGDDNAILGLAIDRTTVHIKLPDPTDESGDTMLPPCPVLVCLTLEGKLSFFSVARLGENSQVPDLVTPPSNVPNAKRSISQPSSQLTSKQDTTSALIPFSPTVVKVELPNGVIPTSEPPAQATVLHLREDNKDAPSPSGTMTRTKPAVKDERDSLFERLTSASPPFPHGTVGDQPSESSKWGPTLMSEEAKKSIRIPTSPSVTMLRDLTGPMNMASPLEGLFRPFDDQSIETGPPQVQRGSQLPSVSSSLLVNSSVSIQTARAGPAPAANPHTSMTGPITIQTGPPQGRGSKSPLPGNSNVPLQNAQSGPVTTTSSDVSTSGTVTIQTGPPQGQWGSKSPLPGNSNVPLQNAQSGPVPTTSSDVSTSGTVTIKTAPLQVRWGSQLPSFNSPVPLQSVQTGPVPNASKGTSATMKTAPPLVKSVSQFPPGSSSLPVSSDVSLQSIQSGPTPPASVRPGSQGVRVGPAPNPTGSFGAPAKSPLGVSAAPKVISNQRTPERFTSSSRLLQEKQPIGRARAVTDMEAAFNAELEDVRKMSEEVGQLMLYIEGRWQGYNTEAPVAFTKQSLEELEQGIHYLSKECKAFREQLNKNKEAIEDLRDEEMRVDAWRIYTQSIMDQKNDSRYHELWNSQKLHPELEMKRKRLLKADQELKQHIAELEEHLHILELKHFQQGNTRRRTNKQVQSPGHFFSAQHLYNTVNTQMAAAEELSNGLTQKMDALNIKWSPQTPQSTASKILKSVGADTDDFENGQSPFPRTRLSYSPMPKGASMNGLSALSVQDNEPSLQETTTSRRDSLDAAWVKQTPTTTIKRVARTRPSQNVSRNALSTPRIRQWQNTVSDVQSTEKRHFSQTAQPAQSTQMVPSSAIRSFCDQSFEGSVLSSRERGIVTSTSQWPSSQPEVQQTRPGPSFGDLKARSSATYQGSAGQTINTNPKETLFKWANPTAMSKSGTTSSPSTFSPTPPAKQSFEEKFDGAGLASSKVLPAAKPASSSTSDRAVPFNFAHGPFGKSTTTGNADRTEGAFRDTSQSRSKMGTTVGHKLGSLSVCEIQFDDTIGQSSKVNEVLDAPTSLQAIPSSVPPSTASAPTAAYQFAGSNSVMAGPTSLPQISRGATATGVSKGGTITGISLSFQSAQSRNLENDFQTSEKESNLPSSKEASSVQLPSFAKIDSTKVSTPTVPTPGNKRETDFEEKQARRSLSDSANSAKIRDQILQGPPDLFSGDFFTSSRPIDLNSSESANPPSTVTASSISTLSSTAPPIAPPPVRTPDSKPIFASTQVSGTPEANTSTVKGSTDSPSANLGYKLKQAETEMPGNTGATSTAVPATPVAPMERPSSRVAKLDGKTPTDSKGSSSTISGVSAESMAATTATNSIFSGPSVSTGLLSGNASNSNSGQAFTASTGSAFSSTSVPNQSSGSLFASSSTPAFSTSSPQSISSSPFGQSTFEQSSPFGQSSQQPTQQPFMFPGSSSSSMVSNPTISLPQMESNEEDMEEEASTGVATFGGFGGLGLGTSATQAQTPKASPFGGSNFGNSQPFQLTPPTGGQLFRPATFSLPAAQSSPQQAGGSTFGSGFGSPGFSQNNLFSEAGKGFGSPPQSTGGGFGQPAQVGPGQQALGSALGAFGQTRQVGFGTPFGNSGVGSPAGRGFANPSPGSGFAGAASGAGFTGAPMGGGFAGAASGGGFAGAASGGGFAGAASGGGFGSAAGAGAGFGGMAGGQGFQAFAGNQGASPGFGSAVPPAQTNLFTQMRK